jgi:tape measure domain-containing protein
MASNAKFEIEIYGNTAKFENSLKGINTAMSGLKGEANALKKALALDPTNTDKMAQLQKNLQQQLTVSKNKATQLKQEIANVDKSTPQGQAKWTKLQRDLANTTIQADQLEADIKDVDNAIKNGKWETKAKIDMDTSGVDSKIGGFKQKFNGLKEIAVGAFRQIGASITNALGNGLKGWASDAMDTQKSMNALKSTMSFKGNGKDFDFVSDKMKKLAQDTNASSEDTLKLSTTFIGLGDDAKTAVSKTDALTRANQKFGGTGEQLKGVAQAYGQMSASGKVTAENMNQLTDNNTALGSALKSTVMEMNPALKKYGSFAEASEKGAVTTEMLDKAMQEMANKGGSAISSIGDSWDAFNEAVSNDVILPILEALTPVISSLIDSMADMGPKIGESIKKVIGWFQKLFKMLESSGALDNFLEIWATLKRTFSDVGKFVFELVKSFLGLDKQSTNSKGTIEQVSDVITTLSEDIARVTRTISDIIHKFTESKTAMDLSKGAIVGLSAGFVAFKIGKGVIAGIEAFIKLKKAMDVAGGAMNALKGAMSLGIWGIVVAAIVAVVAALVYFFTQTKTGKKLWKQFTDFLVKAWESVVKFFEGIGKWFSDIWNATVEGAKGIWQGLVDWFSGIVQGIQDAWNGMIDFFTNLWSTIIGGISDAWSGITDFFTNLWNSIVEVVTNVWNTITEFLSQVVQNIMNFFQPLISFYQSLWNLIWSIINLVIQLILAGIRGLVDGITNIWNGLVNVVKTVWDAIKGVIDVVVEAIKNGIKAMGDFINGVWTAIKNFFTPIFQTIGNFASQVFQSIANVASQVWGTIQGIWGVVSGWFSGVFDAVRNVVSNVFNAFSGFASNAWNGITGVFSAVGSWFSGVFDSVKTAVSNVFDSLGGIAQNAWDSITSVFSGVYDFFADAFGGVKDLIDSILGGISGTLDKISGAINGVSKTVSGMFKGSLVEALPNVNLSGVGNGGITQNSASADNRIYNTFTLGADNGNIVALAREVTKLQKLGRA